MLIDSLVIDKKNHYAMAELISVYKSLKQPEKCFETFDKFLKQLKLKKERRCQAMFNNIFQLCKRFNRSDKALEYYTQYSNILDDRNIELYKRLF